MIFEAAPHIALFWCHIAIQLWLTACKSCLVHCMEACHRVFLEAIHEQLYFLSFKYSFSM